MKYINQSYIHEIYHIKDDGTFPNNSEYPVVVYKRIFNLPAFFAASTIRKIFKENNWKNSWKYGVYEYHHYHSITHEVLGISKGKTILLLGGEHGVKIEVEKGDVIIIPAGVAHKNLGKKNNIVCIGAYPEGKDYDMNYGKASERPNADKNVKNVMKPETDPVFGKAGGIAEHWK